MIFKEIEIDGFTFKFQFNVYHFEWLSGGEDVNYSGIVINHDSPIDNPNYMKALREASRQHAIMTKVINAIKLCQSSSPNMITEDNAKRNCELIEFALSQDVVDITEYHQELGEFLNGIYSHQARKKSVGNYDKYLQTDHWKSTRERALEDADYECWNCGSTDRLHVHHLTYDRTGNELPEDLMVLCASCHGKEHTKTRSK